MLSRDAFTQGSTWLYDNKIIDDKNLVENAVFFANINAALEECDSKTRNLRCDLLKKIERTGKSSHHGLT